MKVLMLSTGMGLGGAETQICDLAKRMTALHHEVHVAWLTGEAGVVIPTGVTPHPFNIRKTPLGLIKAIIALKKLIKDLKPDVVHAHMVHANIVARLVRLIKPMPKLICTAHSSNEGGRIRMLAYRFTDSLADMTTHVSQEATEIFIKKGASKTGRIVTVHNGVDTARFRPDSYVRLVTRKTLGLQNKIVVMMVGRLEHPKNHASLIRAFAQLSEFSPDLHLVLVGSGALENDLRSQVAIAEMNQKVTFLGARYDVPALFNAADIAVLSSRFEGFGLVVAEAMATEKLVVATECGGVAVLIKKFGIIVPPENDKALLNGLKGAVAMISPAMPQSEKLADKNKTHSEASDQIQVMTQLARKHIVQNFSLDAIVDRWLQIYRCS